MDWLILAAFVLGGIVFAAVANRVGLIDLSDKTSRPGATAGAAVGTLDEVFQPTRYEAAIEMNQQTILPAPAPIPGDGGEGRDIYSGRVTIDVR
jgi:hypothetical protein